MGYSSGTKLISSLSGCYNLTWLSLARDFRFFLLKDFPIVKFPKLETLILDGVTLSDNVELLFDGCPVLENLAITICIIQPVDTFRICIILLKHLVLEWCLIDGDTTIVLNTPELDCLCHFAFCDVSYSFASKFDQIRGLSIILRAPVGEDPNFNDLMIAEIVKACSEVESLNLGDSAMEVLHHLSLPLPIFCNLKRVLLNVVGLAGWSLFGRLLKNAPKLNIVTLDRGSNMLDGYFDCFRESAQGIPHCLASSMKVVGISAFKGHEDEIKFIEYILENGKVLEKLHLSFCFNWKENFDVFKRIVDAGLKSETCKIIWLYKDLDSIYYDK
ncbi:OLC1v1014164C1 [Oldenlandia corymbosa var. corymbosa]|nr:OLC1v1014164C1 [Oldenlandia corymbosa var. corymbosa]